MKSCLWNLMLCVALVPAVIGCESSNTPNKEADVNASSDGARGIPAAIFVEDAQAVAMGVNELKKSGKSSGDVVVRGRIGGRSEPFVDGAAVFVIADKSLLSCDQRHGDKCKKPWDYCCETPESLVANTATIQLVSDDGKPIRHSAKGQHGLEPLAEIVVTGQVVDNAGGNLIINAKTIAVVKS